MIPAEAAQAALITGGFGVLIALIQRATKENRADHGVVATKLDHLAEGHARIETKIDNHVNDHAKGDL